MIRIASAALLVVLVPGLAGCGETDEPSAATDPDASAALEFTESGGCGDAYFWATTADERHALVLSVALRDRSATAPTVLDFSLPDPEIDAHLWEGTRLGSRMCNDVIEGELTEEMPVVAGKGTITVQPPPEDGFDLVDGKAELTGLVAEDGTELPDLAIKTTSIGFYAG
jgi:hypothetical protein